MGIYPQNPRISTRSQSCRCRQCHYLYDRIFWTYQVTQCARELGLPRIYLSANSGARLGLAEEVIPLFSAACKDQGKPARYSIISISPHILEWLAHVPDIKNGPPPIQESSDSWDHDIGNVAPKGTYKPHSFIETHPSRRVVFSTKTLSKRCSAAGLKRSWLDMHVDTECNNTLLKMRIFSILHTKPNNTI
jgi:hypothetical protein